MGAYILNPIQKVQICLGQDVNKYFVNVFGSHNFEDNGIDVGVFVFRYFERQHEFLLNDKLVCL
jgi:hypothetical protein